MVRPGPSVPWSLCRGGARTRALGQLKGFELVRFRFDGCLQPGCVGVQVLTREWELAQVSRFCFSFRNKGGRRLVRDDFDSIFARRGAVPESAVFRLNDPSGLISPLA